MANMSMQTDTTGQSNVSETDYERLALGHLVLLLQYPHP